MKTMDNCDRTNVVIIGGGPTGLATALMLAQRGWTKITVIEKRPSASYYEPDKSFSYQIDGRGQKLTDWLGLTAKLANVSVANTDFYLTVIQKDGTRKTNKLPIADAKRKAAYWLPRQTFLGLLYQDIIEKWSDVIETFFDTECLEIKKNHDCLEIIVQSKDKKLLVFTPTLVVGCDGLNSLVRQTLHDWEKVQSNAFAMQQFPSASSGLRYKVLTLPPQFPLSNQPDDLSQSTMAYAIRSAFKGRLKAISLGLLPLKNPSEPRTANIITYPNHQIWQLETSEEVATFFEEAFPQIPVKQIISSEEITRFTASKGGTFPIPQYCSTMYQIWGNLQENQGTAVLLLGDAVHCFPPDIGQGVNSALEDVYLLQQILAETQDNLSEALPQYQELRQPDIQALIRLVQISYPWQYNQAILQKRLWAINFFVRFFLSRFLPFIFSTHSFLLIQNHELSYSTILAKSNQTTQALGILVGVFLLTFFLIKILVFKT